ncbi:hypothetical protein SKAU_G00068410 [Synaphobranchus kaupii]|uniref:Uncharacterized protein n=1 Tax=Synaphobranchus kaupii TaxID=118154 RepID=A0A9Q1JAA6_SYNKA|nr:hypothetical protein SKAU_G00068410 [Synaphobranchus kaupii]
MRARPAFVSLPPCSEEELAHACTDCDARLPPARAPLPRASGGLQLQKCLCEETRRAEPQRNLQIHSDGTLPARESLLTARAGELIAAPGRTEAADVPGRAALSALIY